MTRRKIHLVRHGRSAVDRSRPPHEWGLDPSGHGAVLELRESGRLPDGARWFSSPWFDDPAEFRDAVRRAFETPERSSLVGWEPLAAARDRVVPAVRRILLDHPQEEIVLAGHGTAWTLLVAELTGSEPDLEAWSRLRMPDLWVVDEP